MIFLISLPRSGSTLLQRIISSHEDIFSTAEPWLMLHPAYALKDGGIATEYDSGLARKGLADFLSAIGQDDGLYISAIRKMAGVLYGKALEISGKKFFLDKTPRYYYIIHELYRIFPQAKFIFLLRNPLAVYASVLRTWFMDDAAKLKDTTHYRDMIAGPQRLIDGIKAIGGNSSVVHYEKLIENPQETAKQLCKWIGLEYRPDMIEYGKHQAPHGRFGDMKSVHLHEKPVRDYAENWVNYFSDAGRFDVAKDYLDMLGPQLISDLGYDYADMLNRIEQAGFFLARDGKKDVTHDDPGVLQNNEARHHTELSASDRLVLEMIRLGEEFFNAGEYENSMGAFQSALDIHPGNARANSNMAVIHWQSGDRDKAIENLIVAFSQDPSDRTVVLNLGESLTATGRQSDAAAVYEAYLQHNPNDSEIVDMMRRNMVQKK